MYDRLHTAEGSQAHTRVALISGEATWQRWLLAPQPMAAGGL